MRHLKPRIRIISQELFQYSLVTYLILLIIDKMQEGFVSNFFNLNILLTIVIVSGVIMILNQVTLSEATEPVQITASDISNIILFALLGAFLVYSKTKDLGQISLFITAITFFIIFLLSYLFLSDTSGKTQD